MANKNGKSGTITPEEFETLSSMVGQFGPMVIGAKLAKICTRMSAGYLHEHANSLVGKAWSGLAAKIGGAVGAQTRAIPSADFTFLTTLVTNYGPEVVVQKVAKIALKAGNTVNGNTLKVLFPASSTKAA